MTREDTIRMERRERLAGVGLSLRSRCFDALAVMAYWRNQLQIRHSTAWALHRWQLARHEVKCLCLRGGELPF